MITVYQVSAQDFPATRLHLPCTPWGNTVRERLIHLGYSVQALGEVSHPDTRTPEELGRRDWLLDATGI